MADFSEAQFVAAALVLIVTGVVTARVMAALFLGFGEIVTRWGKRND